MVTLDYQKPPLDIDQQWPNAKMRNYGLLQSLKIVDLLYSYHVWEPRMYRNSLK